MVARSWERNELEDAEAGGGGVEASLSGMFEVGVDIE